VGDRRRPVADREGCARAESRDCHHRRCLVTGA
jgi:hypothetical protein